MPPGPYLMLPLLGPATLGDAPNRVAENFLQPFYWYNYGNERWFSLALNLVDTRARLLPAEEAFANVYDRYAFLRDVSIARMQSPSGWIEPGQRPEFDEYTVVLRGMLRVESKDGTFEVHAGQAVIVRKGEWVRYSSPGPDGAEYVAVCLPAFSPETVRRDS